MGRKESEEQFILALEQTLREGKEPGINQIAETAGLNKVLIYRYFNGLEGLMEVFAQRVNLWERLRRAVEEGLAEGRWKNPSETGRAIFKSYRELLQQEPLFLTIFQAELSSHNPLTRRLEKDREQEGLKIVELVQKAFPDAVDQGDTAAVSTLIISAITYLMLKSRDTSYFTGINLQSEEGWERLESAYFSFL